MFSIGHVNSYERYIRHSLCGTEFIFLLQFTETRSFSEKQKMINCPAEFWSEMGVAINFASKH